jgi:gliding motility-associated-like protein
LLIADASIAQQNVVDGQEYFAQIKDVRTGCNSVAKLTVSVRSLPAVMNTVITQCEDAAGTAVATGIDLNEYRFTGAITKESNVTLSWHYSEADAAADQHPIHETVMVNKHKEFFARVIYNTEPFCYAIARLDLIVNSQPNIRTIFGRESVCQGHSSSIADNLPVEVYQVMPVQGAKYRWRIPDDSKFRVYGGGGENDFYILLQFPEVYTGKIGVRAELNGCSSPLVEKQIAVTAAPPQPFITGDAIVCDHENHVAFSVSPNNFPASAYNWDVRRLSDNLPSNALITEGQLTGNILMNFAEEDVIISVRENNSSCVSPVATKVVKVMRPPLANITLEKAITDFEGKDGAIKTEVSGGTAPYASYTLVQTGQTDPDNDGIFDHLSRGSYSVKVTDANGCTSTSNVLDLQHPYPVMKASFTATPFASCFPVTIQTQNKSTGADTFIWKLYRSGTLVTTSNLRTPDFKISEPGTYDLHLTASIAGTDHADQAELKGLQVFDVPHAAFELRTEVIYAPDTKVTPINFSAGANQYEWNFGDGTTSADFEPSHQYQQAAKYLLTLKAGFDYGMVDSDGDGSADQQLVCYDSLQKEIVALNGGALRIPNAFTPDTDGPNGGNITNGSFNDIFIPQGEGITEFQMYIYDRWGTLVFESNDKLVGWDGYDRNGKLMPAGAYVYKIMVRLSNGEKITRLGDVTIIL